MTIAGTLRASTSTAAIACASIPATAANRSICSLVDFSVTGVRLELPEDVKLPKDVSILIGNLSHNARVVWRKGALVGVDFVDEHHSIY